MIPSRRQWERWSLPSKYTIVGALVGIVSTVLTLTIFFVDFGLDREGKNVKTELKQAYKEIQDENEKEDQYVKKYLKDRIAEIEDADIRWNGSKPIARVYYSSHLKGLTSNFRASVEIRMLSDLNEEHEANEGWEKAVLLNEEGRYGHATNLGKTDFVDIENLTRGVVYEVRMVDFNYDSNEPPTRPFRFQVQ